MKNLITCLVVSVLSGVTFAETWTVDDDGKADFDNIQAAIDAASDGDEIIVMPGTYTGTPNNPVVYLYKDVYLHSSKGAEVTIIDGELTGQGISCESVGWFTTIEGFTVTNGYINGGGGGMYNNSSSHKIKNCTFANNTSNYSGGGMHNHNSNPTIENCTFTNNTASGGGGGMNNSQSNPMLTDCTFTGNTASYGGGMTTSNDGTPTLTNCIFENNTAETGGGMHNSGGSLMLTDCTFTGNTSTNYGGGGMHNSGDSSPTLTDTIVCGNTPDHIYGHWTDNDGNTIANECPPPAGGCCVSTGCYQTTAVACDGLGGTWLDAGVGCDNCPTTCAADINGDSQVNVNDLILLIAAWGACQ